MQTQFFIKKSPNHEPLLETQNFSNYLYNLLFHNNDDSFQHVMVDEKWVMRDRKLMTVNEEKSGK